jgi:hypothetical protein
MARNLEAVAIELADSMFGMFAAVARKIGDDLAELGTEEAGVVKAEGKADSAGRGVARTGRPVHAMIFWYSPVSLSEGTMNRMTRGSTPLCTDICK